LNVPINDVLKIMLLYVPKTIWYAGPIAFLFSITYILSDLYANNEMTAIFASGISLYRFVAPLIIISVIFSFGLFYLEDKLVVSTLEQKHDLQETLLGTKEDADNSNIIVLSDNGKITYKANRYDDSKRQLRTLYCIFRTEEKKLDSIIYSDSAKWNEEKQLWELQKPVQYKKTDDSLKIMPVDTQLLLLLNEPYDIFRKKIENYFRKIAEGPEHKKKGYFEQKIDEWSKFTDNVDNNYTPEQAEHINRTYYPYNLNDDNRIVNSWLYEYEVFELVFILKTFDWDNYSLIFYGW
jgi:lipopolysaccharide export LptBFGC system permease protein LptF